MTSLTSIGNDAEGTILNQIEGRSLGLDAAGNLVLNSALTSAAATSRSSVGVVGKGIPFNTAITNNTGASSNIANVNFQVQDIYGNAIAGVFNLHVFLSDAATGAGLTATTASGGVAAVSGDGAVLDALVASKMFLAQTNTSGQFSMAITDTAKTGFYPCVQMLAGFAVQVGAQLTTASYHS